MEIQVGSTTIARSSLVKQKGSMNNNGTLRSLEDLQARETPASIELVVSNDNILQPLTLWQWAIALGFVALTGTEILYGGHPGAGGQLS